MLSSDAALKLFCTPKLLPPTLSSSLQRQKQQHTREALLTFAAIERAGSSRLLAGVKKEQSNKKKY